MTVVQTRLEIADDLLARVLTGELVLRGGVVRDLAGRLVKHLDDASPGADAAKAARAAVTKAVTHPRSIPLGLGAAAAVAVTAGGLAVAAARRKKSVAAGLPPRAGTSSAALAAYLEAARVGNLDAGVIHRLIADLDAATDEGASGTISLDLSPAQVKTLVGIVTDHTKNLADANGLELSDLQPHACDPEGATIIDLRRHLETQGRIFGDAA